MIAAVRFIGVATMISVAGAAALPLVADAQEQDHVQVQSIDFPDFASLTLENEFATNPTAPRESRQSAALRVRLEQSVLDAVDLKFDATASFERQFARARTRPAGDRVFGEKELIIDELTASYLGDQFDIVIGIQVQPIGKVDAFQVLDRLNGIDMCRFARLDLDYKRANPMAQVRFFQDNITIRGIFAPFSPENEVADFRASCADTLTNAATFGAVPDPGNDEPADWAGALELTLVEDEFDVGLHVLTLKEADFVLSTFPTFAKDRPRVLWFGASFATGVLDGVLRTELGFTPKRRFTLDPAETFGLVASGTQTDGTDERWNGLGLVGYEYSYDDWTADLQLLADIVEGGSQLVRPELAGFASLRLRKAFLNDRLASQLFSVYDLTNQDIAVRLELTYELQDGLNLQFGYVHYGDLAKDAGFFGTFDGRSEVFLKTELEF